MSNALHPALRELLKLIPPPSEEFPIERRIAWLRAFANTVSFIYDPPGDEVTIEIFISDGFQS